MRILVVDNYDSFVYNLVQYLEQLGAECLVRRHDEITVSEAAALAGDGLLLSPGPGGPAQAGICLPLVDELAGRVPILGVCLGHQVIGAAYGATIDQAPELLHGQTSLVSHHGEGVFAELPDPFEATRYHSLAIVESTLPPELAVTARSEHGVIMGVRHRRLPIEGVQFHPESVLSQAGHLLLANWLAECGLPAARTLAPALGAELDLRRQTAFAGLR
ncbi:aminodeoxychorismate/anthranilate synthase component II [Natronosporangium hydrolyticum]|uniref:Aminodeoxychorismate/anthranilate synthase component II n=1 Tax=Natronosporangium hydrolyticum TaxID=2811111 RepID=A0A895YLJ9_9ACTN|nr:aminodeoxychorismate/anthranilate synthase component II [Natronosporangium hydrolyticum]QSB14758.1 aminodeoxychorismate/anthranilate synthase component II [Natronosporangium hydrolyticum]